MKTQSCCVVISAAVLTFAGCISAERKAEYAAWQASEDGMRNVMLDEFEAKYQQGWRERAEEKARARLAREEKERQERLAREERERRDRLAREERERQDRLAREEAARTLARRKGEYDRWLASDDKENGVSLEVFEQKYKEGWEGRAEQKKLARLKREEKARQEAKRRAYFAGLQRRRDEVRDVIVAADLSVIRTVYEIDQRYINPFLVDRQDKEDDKSDWLSKWASPRLGLSEADALAGEALLSEFGTKYLPNAYANYEKKRDALIELQQVFNEEFPQPWTIKVTNPKWNSFNKVLEKFVKSRTEYFLCHDELCHYWLLRRFGALSDKDFAQIDTQRLAVHLLPENVERVGYTLLKMNAMEGKISDFAVKYAPELNVIYQKMGLEFKELDALLSEVFKQHIQMDDARYSRALSAAVAKRNDLVREMNTLTLQLQTWYMDHRTTEKSSEDVAKCDAEMSKQLKPFMDALPSYIKDHALGPIIANVEMIAIPGQRYRMLRTEVTQIQWMAVMGNNPSQFRGPDRPVENVSWDDCQKFIKRVGEMDDRKYRLPTETEWKFACLAGSATEWGRRVNGERGPLEMMGWCSDNNQGNEGTHAVALKEPNAWGLFDMHGNVWEWCEDVWGLGRLRCVSIGGSWGDCAGCCAASSRAQCNNPGASSGFIGFRLAADME